MKLSELLGASPGSTPANSRVSKALKRAGVRESPEFRRVLSLPRRRFDASDYPDASPLYAKGPCNRPGCQYCANGGPRLKPLQSAMIVEAAQSNGLFASVGVGGGKTLASFLMHDAMNARRTVLLVPPNLRDKTLRIDLPDLERHFQLPLVFPAEHALESNEDGVYVVAYSELSAIDASDLLDIINPDLVVADEAHNLRHKDAARTRRFLRYMRKNAARFVAMSGSIANRSIIDMSHLIELCLGARSPLPKDHPSLMEWADAIDNEEKKSKGGEFGHTEPGALMLFCEADESVRDGFRRRLIESPGVISTTERSCGANIEIRTIRVTPPLPVLQALEALSSKWAWDGIEYDKAIEIARVERTLTQGFFYRLIWPGGVVDTSWRDARNAWRRAVRDRLSHTNREGQDSPGLLEAMAERGEWTPPEWFTWQGEAHKPEPEKEAIEVSRWIIPHALAWAKAGPGIIWVDSPVVGQWLAEEGIPYYGEGADREVLDLAESNQAGLITVALSRRAHGTGKNLQKWSRNLVTYPPANGSDWEQMLGRTHRPGQLADTVTVDLLLASHAAERAWDQARADARFAEQTTANPQLLNLATLAIGSSLV